MKHWDAKTHPLAVATPRPLPGPREAEAIAGALDALTVGGIRGWVRDAGGGEVVIVVDRATTEYPRAGQAVLIVAR